jgi:hypothetical protein
MVFDLATLFLIGGLLGFLVLIVATVGFVVTTRKRRK